MIPNPKLVGLRLCKERVQTLHSPPQQPHLNSFSDPAMRPEASLSFFGEKLVLPNRFDARVNFLPLRSAPSSFPQIEFGRHRAAESRNSIRPVCPVSN